MTASFLQSKRAPAKMYATVTVIAGLVSGLILFAAFSVLDVRSPFQHQYEQKNTVIITIPPRAAGQNSGKNFDPAEATVVAGQNNTVQWTNRDNVPEASEQITLTTIALLTSIF